MCLQMTQRHRDYFVTIISMPLPKIGHSDNEAATAIGLLHYDYNNTMTNIKLNFVSGFWIINYVKYWFFSSCIYFRISFYSYLMKSFIFLFCFRLLKCNRFSFYKTKKNHFYFRFHSENRSVQSRQFISMSLKYICTHKVIKLAKN